LVSKYFVPGISKKRNKFFWQETISAGTRIDPKKRMPDSTKDNLGRRRFLLHRDKAVENALERIRRSPAAGWETLTPDERSGLKTALTEIWDCCGRERWEQYCFSTLSRTDILTLTAIVCGIRERHGQITKERTKIEAILLSCTRDPSLR
jgi:hypothetical protein